MGQHLYKSDFVCIKNQRKVYHIDNFSAIVFGINCKTWGCIKIEKPEDKKQGQSESKVLVFLV